MILLHYDWMDYVHCDWNGYGVNVVCLFMARFGVVLYNNNEKKFSHARNTALPTATIHHDEYEIFFEKFDF